MTPVGTTVRSKKPSAENLITIEQAQKIAEELIKQFPGQYQSGGNRGGGTSSGADGIVTRDWSFEFVPSSSTDKNDDQRIILDISDRGELVGFSLGEGADFQIDIHAGNGQVTQFWSIREDREIDSLPEITKTITAEEAKNVEIKQKKPVLTYFLPGVDWRYGELVEKSQPMLVYR